MYGTSIQYERSYTILIFEFFYNYLNIIKQCMQHHDKIAIIYQTKLCIHVWGSKFVMGHIQLILLNGSKITLLRLTRSKLLSMYKHHFFCFPFFFSNAIQYDSQFYELILLLTCKIDIDTSTLIGVKNLPKHKDYITCGLNGARGSIRVRLRKK